MKRLLDKIIPQSIPGSLLLVIIFTGALMSLLFKLFPYIYGSIWGRDNRELLVLYGFAVFILIPIFVGVLTVLTVSYHGRVGIGQGIGLSLLALLGVGLSVLIYAIEGVICLIMALPICAAFTVAGSLIGYAISRRSAKSDANVLGSYLIFLLVIPSASYLEGREPEPELTPVVTTIVINAPPEKVWKNVVEFPEIAPPAELIFKAGIAYPVRARMEGSGVGAARYCDFSTGTFVERVTIWDENQVLQFSVGEQPSPMSELSPYGALDTPHLHGFFVSRKGQFKLTRLENGSTLVEGTSWYYHKISPEIYWRLWSEEIIHTIHRRVLEHIKDRSENE